MGTHFPTKFQRNANLNWFVILWYVGTEHFLVIIKNKDEKESIIDGDDRKT